jgi:hypothetical protein
MKTNIKLTALFAVLSITVFSCSKLDVVGNDSARAFNDILQKAPYLVLDDTGMGGWAISAPDSSANFICWSRKPSQYLPYNLMIEFDSAPFIAAGLNPALLVENFVVYENVIITGISFEPDQLQYDSNSTPLSMYKQIVKLRRNIIGYHREFDHYGISLGNGNMFEWAKKLTTNDKDIVFVLNPDPFIAAGADPAKISGWVFAKVTVDDEKGKPVQVDKLLKSFDL